MQNADPGAISQVSSTTNVIDPITSIEAVRQENREPLPMDMFRIKQVLCRMSGDRRQADLETDYGPIWRQTTGLSGTKTYLACNYHSVLNLRLNLTNSF